MVNFNKDNTDNTIDSSSRVSPQKVDPSVSESPIQRTQQPIGKEIFRQQPDPIVKEPIGIDHKVNDKGTEKTLLQEKIELIAHEFLFSDKKENSKDFSIEHLQNQYEIILSYFELTQTADPILFHCTESLAQQYIEKGDFSKAMNIRMRAAQVHSPSHPFTEWNTLLKKAPKTQFGIIATGLDSTLLKNHCLIVQDRGHLHLEGELMHGARDQLDKTLKEITTNPDLFCSYLPKGFCQKVTATETNDLYYKCVIDNDKWDSKIAKDPSQGYKFGKAKEIHFEGVGKVIFGDSKEIYNNYKRIQIELDPDARPEAAEKIKVMLSALGLGGISTNSRPMDDKKIQILTLFRALYPSQAYPLERDPNILNLPITKLQEEIEKAVPEMKEVFPKYLDPLNNLMYKQEVYPGQEVWCVRVADEARKNGAIGIFQGLTGPEDNIFESIDLIMDDGALSTQDRLKNGIIKLGASPKKDLKKGGGKNFCGRIMVEALLGYPSDDFALSSGICILWDINLVDRAYAYEKDLYGTKDKDVYGKRKNIPETVLSLNQTDKSKPIKTFEIFDEHGKKIKREVNYETRIFKSVTNPGDEKKVEFIQGANNEVCVPNRVGPEHMRGILVRTQKQKIELIKKLEKSKKIVTENGNKFVIIKNRKIPVEKFIHVGSTFPRYAWLDPDQQDKAIIQMAQQSALEQQSTQLIKDGTIHSHSTEVLDGLREFFKTKSVKELEKYYRRINYFLLDYDETSKKIKSFATKCSKRFDEQRLNLSGQDSLNRELLVSKKLTSFLSDPEVILGIFAAEASAEKGDTAGKDKILIFKDRLVSQMIYHGLKAHHPVLLESLPLNNATIANLSNDHLKEYQERKNIQETFVPVLKAIDKAYEEVYGHPPILNDKPHPLDEPYDIKQWGKYKKVCDQIVDHIKDKDETSLFKLESNYTPDQLKKQVKKGFNRLFKLMKIDPTKLSLDEVVDKILSSHEILDQGVSHILYDRLHLLVALRSQDLKVSLKDGEVAIGDIFLRAFEKLGSEGANVNNAIAAEQFYIRMMMIAEKLNL